MTSREPEYLPPIHRSVNDLRRVEDNLEVTFFSPFFERLRRKTVEERNRTLAAVREFIEEKTRISQAMVGYHKETEKLRYLDRIRETESKKMLATLEREEIKALEGLEITKLELFIKRTELEIKALDARDRLDRKRNPPPSPQRGEARDPVMDAIRDTVFGGGKYKKGADEYAEDLAARRGGKQKLTPEDEENIRNAYQRAAEADLSKGRR